MGKKTTGIKAKLLEHFTKHPGQTLFLHDMSDEIGVMDGQVQASMSYLIRQNFLPGLEVVTRGHSWTYKPNGAKGSRRLFEELATAKNGDLVLQDSDGSLWRARPLD